MSAWENSLPEAIERLRAHLAVDGAGQSKPVRFDARDRMALEFVLAIAGDVADEEAALNKAGDAFAGLFSVPGTSICTRDGCGLPTLTGGVCVTCEPR